MMLSEEPVYVILLTPPGRGAIATLRLEGVGAIDRLRPWVRRLSGQPVEDFPTDRPLVVRFGPAPAEEVVLRCFGPQAVEIHCHGGRAAVGRIQSLLAQSGCQVVDWKTWLAEQPADPIAKEAIFWLTAALTERTAAILLDQLHGALATAVRQIIHAVESEQISLAGEQLAALLDRTALGKHLTAPWQVVLVGRPNVGKSSLLNALLGYSRAIVHPQPGTTRDLVTAATALDGWPIQLVDTAGWRDSADPLEQAGIALARQQAQQADLVLVVTDLSQPWTETDVAFCRAFPAGLLVHNKCDLLPNPAHPEQQVAQPTMLDGVSKSSPMSVAAPAEMVVSCSEPPFPRIGEARPLGLCLSARTGVGLPALIQAIVRRLASDPPPPGAAVPFTDRQIQALQAAQQHLRQNDRGAALDALQNILSGSPTFSQEVTSPSPPQNKSPSPLGGHSPHKVE